MYLESWFDGTWLFFFWVEDFLFFDCFGVEINHICDFFDLFVDVAGSDLGHRVSRCMID